MSETRKYNSATKIWKASDEDFMHLPNIIDYAMLSEMWATKTLEEGRYSIKTKDGNIYSIRQTDYIVQYANGDVDLINAKEYEKMNNLTYQVNLTDTQINLLEELTRYWNENPYLRFNQLINNLQHRYAESHNMVDACLISNEKGNCVDLYYTTDKAFGLFLNAENEENNY